MGESSPLPQFDISTFESQIFWLVLFFTIFYFYIKTIVAPYFFSEIESRDMFVDNGLSDIRKLQKKANYLSDDYKEKVQAAHLKANDILSDAKKNAVKKIDKMNHEFSESARDELTKSIGTFDEEYSQTKDVLDKDIDPLYKICTKKLSI